MTSESSSSSDEFDFDKYDNKFSLNDWDGNGLKPAKLDQLTNKYVSKILQGEKPYIEDEGSNFWDLLHDKLKIYTENANCIYFAAVCFDEDDHQRKTWLEKAVKLGSREAIFEYSRLTYNENKEESVKQGVEAIKAGYREKHKIWKFDGRLPYHDYYELSLEYYISQLESENKTLKQELQEEKLRPPELGVSNYNQAKEHFENNQ